MSRLRIRTLKPDNWADEAVGSVSRDARLLRDVLITMADDDGRWRHLPAAIIGHGYPWDDDVTPAKVRRWSAELERAGIVILYDGGQYGCFPRWHSHQRINRYTASSLPPCDDPRVVLRNGPSTTHGELSENSVSPPPLIGSVEGNEEKETPKPPRGLSRGRVRGVAKDGQFVPSKVLDDVERALYEQMGVALPPGATAADAELACEGVA